jgi:tetratricopeptide (TPR) repeat protein
MDRQPTASFPPALPPRQALDLLAALPLDWLHLAWTGQAEGLEALLRGQSVDRAVPGAVLLWLAGDAERCDSLLLALDGDHPDLGLIPDPWDLWEGTGQPGPLAALVATLISWRHGWPEDGSGPALELWREWRGAAPPSEWRRLLTGEALALLAMLLTPAGADERLRGELEPPLVEAMGEGVVASHPQDALLFWAGISRRCPSWDYARLKTADLSLQLGQHQRSAAVLAEATEAQRQNPWLHDIEARLAMAQGRLAAALRCWDRAISAASGQAELVELLRQRRREVEWEAELAGGEEASGPSGDRQLDRFAARLEELAQRYGVDLDQGRAGPGVGDGDAVETFAAFLDVASGRLALAG